MWGTSARSALQPDAPLSAGLATTQLGQQPRKLPLLGLGKARRNVLLESTNSLARRKKDPLPAFRQKQGVAATVAWQHLAPHQPALFQAEDHGAHGGFVDAKGGGKQQPLDLAEPALAFQAAGPAQHLAQRLDDAQALDRVAAWMAHPTVCLIRETDDHWSILRQLIEENGISGKRVTDAHLAAMAVSHGATLVSCDRDFARFPQLRWENPVA